MKHALKIFVANLLHKIRERLGAMECKLRGEHKLMSSSFECGGDTKYFYQCGRCDRDAITGQTLEEWINETRH